jgi:hypothetical protein
LRWLSTEMASGIGIFAGNQELSSVDSEPS